MKKEQIKEEFKKHFHYVQLGVTEKEVDWWLYIMAQREEELKRKIKSKKINGVVFLDIQVEALLSLFQESKEKK